MRKKLLVILLLVVLIVLVVTRCGGKKDQQNDPADGQGFAQQSGKAELPAELKLGVVTETESGAMQLEVEQNGEKTVYVFSDITINDWYVPAVNYVVTNGLMSGTDVGGGLSLFRPNYGMTRAQLAMILYRFAGGEPVAAPRHTYGDVSSGEWYELGGYQRLHQAGEHGQLRRGGVLLVRGGACRAAPSGGQPGVQCVSGGLSLRAEGQRDEPERGAMGVGKGPHRGG